MIVDQTQNLIKSLDLPPASRVDQRIPKKLLLEKSTLTVSDKRLITDAVEQLQWVAALKPSSVGLAEYKDEQREYLEIAVLTVALKDTVGAPCQKRIAELVHRAIPYPTLLLLCCSNVISISLANKRWSQSDAAKVVLDGDVISLTLDGMTANEESVARDFLRTMSLSNFHHNLLDLYQGWIASVEALKAAGMTGSFVSKSSQEEIVARRVALYECERLKVEGDRIRALAKNEKQMVRKVELNLSLKRIENELAVAQKNI